MNYQNIYNKISILKTQTKLLGFLGQLYKFFEFKSSTFINN